MDCVNCWRWTEPRVQRAPAVQRGTQIPQTWSKATLLCCCLCVLGYCPHRLPSGQASVRARAGVSTAFTTADPAAPAASPLPFLFLRLEEAPAYGFDNPATFTPSLCPHLEEAPVGEALQHQPHVHTVRPLSAERGGHDPAGLARRRRRPWRRRRRASIVA
eukprot:364844-Chlamydomonas_euryale.AAC.5